MMQLPINLTLFPVEGWGYERAFCTGRIYDSRYDDDAGRNAVDRLHYAVAAQFGARADNKQTFRFNTADCDSSIYLTFHDGNLYIGTGVRAYHGGELPNPDYHPKDGPGVDDENGFGNPYITHRPV